MVAEVPRYAPRDSGWIEDEHYSETPQAGAPIITDSHVPIDTGLLYANGRPVMRLPNPVGFGRDSEW
jgi:hypothetical protein